MGKNVVSTPRKFIRDFVYWLLSKLFPDLCDRRVTVRRLLRHVVAQKVLRINSHVPWLVHWTSVVIAVDKIEHGTRNPGLSMGCYLDGRNGIVIGNGVRIGPKVNLISMNHQIDDYECYVQGAPIIIGDHCWLATGATILAGVQLGKHVVVAAGAVVTKSFLEDDILLAGVPAKVIRKLEPYSGIQYEE
jgi:acetyltransferase-like isoleucine patch superfamily enzyme